MIKEDISRLGFQPNVAKVAGLVAFWIRRLKPASIDSKSPNYYRSVNEELALIVALAIANLYKNDKGIRKKIVLPPGELQDLAKDFRYHSHTPHSLIMLFELLLEAKVISIPPEE